MKILVAVKRVVDFNVKVRVKADGSGVDLANVKMAMNPFDEIAVEEALRLKEAGKATEVIAVSVGEPGAAETIRTALAMGADPRHPGQDGGAARAAGGCQGASRGGGEGAAGGLPSSASRRSTTTPTRRARCWRRLLDWPIATFASKVVIEEGSALVTREVDGGHETVRLPLPAVVTTDLRLNEPRYASLPNIMKAKRKPIEETTTADLGVDTTPRLTVVKVSEPPGRRAGGARCIGCRTGRAAAERSGGAVTTLLIAEHDGSGLKEATARGALRRAESSAPTCMCWSPARTAGPPRRARG